LEATAKNAVIGECFAHATGDEGRASAAHGAAEVCARRLRLQVERVRGDEDGRMDSIEYSSEDRRAAGGCASAASQHEITGARCVSVMLMTG
jgi:hypothetical protein